MKLRSKEGERERREVRKERGERGEGQRGWGQRTRSCGRVHRCGWQASGAGPRPCCLGDERKCQGVGAEVGVDVSIAC